MASEDGRAGGRGGAGRERAASWRQAPQDWVGAWSEKRAALTPDRVALVDRADGTRYTYADLEERARRTARSLDERGVTDGGRVAVVSRNRPAVIDCFFATGKTGGVLAPLSHRLPPPDLAALLDAVDPALLLVEEPFESLVDEALGRDDCDATPAELALATDGEHRRGSFDAARSASGGAASPSNDAADAPIGADPNDWPTVSLDDPHLLLHTGGSTGVPKEAVLTHGAILWNSVNTIVSWGLRDDDLTPLTFPTFHTGGWNVVTLPLFHLGGTVAIDREVDPGDLLRVVESEGATVLVAVPAVLRSMARDDAWDATDLSSLRLVKSGGGPCRERVMEAWWDRGVDLSQGYGLTECGPNNFAMPDGWPREKAHTVGKPVLHADARVVDDDGDPVDPGSVGELELRSPHAAAGYVDREAETETTFGGGWVSTGDLARVDAEGYYSIEGRTKDVFVSGGENVYPAKVEDVLADHPGVEEVVVVPVADEQWGEVGKAVVVGDESLSVDEVRAFCEGKLARFEHPRAVAVVDDLPTSGPSKVDRQAVRERFGS